MARVRDYNYCVYIYRLARVFESGELPRADLISVIVPARNESDGIRECLSALRSQSLPADQYELLVIDNGSADDTAAIAREFTRHVHSLPGITVGALRNRGAALARGDVLAFIDADCVASPTWLAGACAALAEGGVAVGNTYDRPAVSDGSDWIEALWFGDVRPGRHHTHELWSGNLIVGKADFQACGGFDERLVSYEDVALSRSLGHRGMLYLDDRVRVTHVGGPKTVAEFARQQLWHGFEEWTAFRLGIKRETFLPTMIFIIAIAAVLASIFLPAAAASIALGSGIAAIALVTLRRVFLQLRSFKHPSVTTVVRLVALNFIFLSVKSIAVALRACNLHWSGR